MIIFFIPTVNLEIAWEEARTFHGRFGFVSGAIQWCVNPPNMQIYMLEPEQMQWLRIQAATEGREMSEIVANALALYKRLHSED